MKALIPFLLAVFFCFAAAAQSFGVHCVRVNEDGSATIDFSAQTGSDFEGYQVWVYDEALATYTMLATINDINQTSYTDPNSNAASASCRYMIRAIFSSSTAGGATISTIYLAAAQNPDGNVDLFWNDFGATPPQGSETHPYKIYRKRTSTDTDWVFVAEQENNHYTDTLPPICLDTVCYRIVVENDNGCHSCSNVSRIEVTDTQIPNEPFLLSSSVDVDSQRLNLNWTPSNSEDVYGYVICAGSPCVAIDTVWGADASNYVCGICDVQMLNSLAVMAIDSCYNTSLRTETHTNMVLKATHGNCAPTVSLLWNAYADFASGVASYNIYVKSETSQGFSLAMTTTDAQATVPIELSARSYAFYVEAVANDGTRANSNVATIDLAASRQVAFIDIRKVSVMEDNQTVELEFFVDASLPVNAYVLERSKDGGSYNRIATIPYTGASSLTYTDHLPASAAEHSYRYVFSSPDECGVQLTSSSSVSPMVLSLQSVDGTTNMLTWTPYAYWQNSVAEYQVFRYAPSQSVPTFVSSTSSTSFTDNTADMLSSDDRVFYFVRAVENGQGADGKTQSANSTRASAVKQTIFFIPNAFTPREIENNVFKPECHFVRQDSYRLRVFNRYGTLLFETDDPQKGWDGTFKGEFCRGGVYVYVVEFVNSLGEKEVRKGSIALVE